MALLRMLERCLAIYTGPDSFPYTNFPVYKLFRIQTFLYTNFPVYKLSLVAFFFTILYYPQNNSKPLLLSSIVKHCPQRNPFKTLGNTSPSKALLRMLERCLSIYTGPDSFPYTNFPVYKLSRVAFFSSFFTIPKTILNPFCSQALSPKKNPLTHWGIPPLLRHY